MPDQDLYPTDYTVTYVPTGCTKYTLNQTITVFAPDPPPADITLHPSGACDGVTAVLVE